MSSNPMIWSSSGPVEGWPKDLQEAFHKKADEFWTDLKNVEHYENPDDFRVSRIGHLAEELAYRKIEERGCCGSFEIEWDLGGVKVRYGFNYGH